MDTPFKQKSSPALAIGKILLVIGIVLIIGCMGFLVGYATPRAISPAALPDSIKTLTNSFQGTDTLDFSVFEDVWKRVNTQYVSDPVQPKDLYYGMLKGLVSGLHDPYSLYLDPEETKAFTSDLEGTFEGIGAEIGIKNESLTVIAPLVGSPAEKAGLRPNDLIVAIDGQSSAGLDIDKAVSLIRGPKGSEVTLLIKRESEEPKEFKITRDTIKTNSVAYEMKDTIALIRLSSFSNDSTKEFNDAISAVMLKNPTGMIVDLRNNPGGLLDASVDISGVFLPRDSVVVIEKGSDNAQKELKTSTNGRVTTLPLVVLVNNGSASAAEIVAGALKDYDRAHLIGEKTFGKGSVQTFEILADGSSIKLTTAKWLTPKGNSFSETGISPDEVVAFTKDDYTNNTDPQLDAAIKYLNK